MAAALTIREARPDEFAAIGRLLVAVYAALPGFPAPHEQPAYYGMLADVAGLAARPGVRVLVAQSSAAGLAAAVVYFGDMAQYGAGDRSTSIRDAAGIRLLAVDPACRGGGVGRRLTQACIDLARADGQGQVILHTTRAMQVAWGLYERLGFVRAEELDFQQQDLPVFGFRLALR
ncbi:N-acetyltransferase [uncultured Piscinibacter sp.]|uniref:GNAT family N-acetyltransferase n=1 Tax=uncultured Piscinibacter sp. TaxID=1131835 RepID=UPI00261B1F33|nr:N-acetyltransferase [uncultured Piscinibacter sp.]